MTRSILTTVALTVFAVGCEGPTTSYEELQDRIQSANDELLNNGNIDRAADFFAPVYVAHAGRQEMRGGPEVIQGFVRDLRTAFPDLHVEVEVLVAEGDRVAWIRTHHGTHQGDFMGVPASGRAITWHDMVVTRYEGDMIAEEWGVSDLGEKLRSQ